MMMDNELGETFDPYDEAATIRSIYDGVNPNEILQAIPNEQKEDEGGSASMDVDGESSSVTEPIILSSYDSSSSPAVLGSSAVQNFLQGSGPLVDGNPVVNVIPGFYIELPGQGSWFLLPETPTANNGVQTDQKFVAYAFNPTMQLESVVVPDDLLRRSTPAIQDHNVGQEVVVAAVPEPDEVKLHNLSTVQELLTLDTSLSDTGIRTALTQEFQKVGGKSSDNHLRRALKHLMTFQVASEFSWAGIKRRDSNKRSFKDLMISNVLIDSIVEIYAKTEDEKRCIRLKLEDGIKEWLKRAGPAARRHPSS